MCEPWPVLFYTVRLLFVILSVPIASTGFGRFVEVSDGVVRRTPTRMAIVRLFLMHMLHDHKIDVGLGSWRKRA